MGSKRVFVVIKEGGNGVEGVRVYTTRSEAARAVGCSRGAIRGVRVVCKGYLIIEAEVHKARMGKAC